MNPYDSLLFFVCFFILQESPLYFFCIVCFLNNPIKIFTEPFFLLCEYTDLITKAPDRPSFSAQKSADFNISTEVTTPKLCWEHVIITTALSVLTSSVQIAHR